jgi:hypothetical protein
MKMSSLLQRMWILALPISFVVASQIAIASSDSGTLTVGSDVLTCGGGGLGKIQTLSGYSISLSFGSYSPTGLTGGRTVADVYDDIGALCDAATFSALTVSGFSSNPGSGWLSSITCNGVTNDESSARSYGYSGGAAGWVWGQLFGLLNKNGSNVSCTIVHN